MEDIADILEASVSQGRFKLNKGGNSPVKFEIENALLSAEDRKVIAHELEEILEFIDEETGKRAVPVCILGGGGLLGTLLDRDIILYQPGRKGKTEAFFGSLPSLDLKKVEPVIVEDVTTTYNTIGLCAKAMRQYLPKEKMIRGIVLIKRKESEIKNMQRFYKNIILRFILPV